MRTLLSCLVFCTVVTGLCSQVFSTVEYLGRPHIKVDTKTATYFYDPVAGGFSRILDAGGKDWVAYRDQPWGEYPASAASSFRGLPNLVFQGDDDGAGHPGHKKCSSEVVGNAIYTRSLSGQWAWTWTFTDDWARLDVTATDPRHPYWFLYEGPAGGNYLPKQSTWGTDQSGPNYDRFDHYRGSKHEGQYQWFYFSTPENDQSFWMAQAEPDTLADHYSLLGNAEIGVDSPDGMTVAGFGRTAPATPLLTGSQTFFIGFYPKPITSRGRHKAIGRTIRRTLNRKRDE